MCKLESSKKDESRAHRADSSKPSANPELLLPRVLVQSRNSVYADALAVSHDPGYSSYDGTVTFLVRLPPGP